MGRIALTLCRRCGLVFNSDFQSSEIDYDESYENSLNFSPAFQCYEQELVSRLRAAYDLNGKHLIGIGSGKGEFLRALCQVGKNYGVGFDPSYTGDDEGPGSAVRFVKDYYSAQYACERADFISCRHVLEHIEQPLDFLLELNNSLQTQPNAVLYFEVPNAQHVLEEGLWDVIYPHVCYFTAQSLNGLFERAGFRVVRTGTSFADQFLFVEAQLHSSNVPVAAVSTTAPPSSFGNVASFGDQFSPAVQQWSAMLSSAASKRIAFWGAGAKGVTFLNVVPNAHTIEAVVDTNMRKHGKYVPGTGQRILDPSALVEFQPDIVITLNPVYKDEISDALAELGLAPLVIASPVPEPELALYAAAS